MIHEAFDVDRLIESTIFIAMVGALTAALYGIAYYIKEAFTKQLYCSIIVENQDPMYDILQSWILKHRTQTPINQLEAQLQVEKKVFFMSGDPDTNKSNVNYQPGAGLHTFFFKGHKIWAQQIEKKTVTAGDQKLPKKLESLTLYTFYGKINLLKEIIETAHQEYILRDHQKLNLYSIHEWGFMWQKVGVKDARQLESVILDQGKVQAIVDDIKEFINAREWYKSVGVPYRRGYLFYGPPGCGKTSIVQSLAAIIKYKIAIINLNSIYDDEHLSHRIGDSPERSIILLEDIDACFQDRTSVQKSKRGVTFSGLLNAIDGVRSKDGTILVMTTNHREKLDPALIRPGRCDLQIEFTLASGDQLRKMFEKFFPESTQLAKDFAHKLPEYKISMAKLQGHFLKYKKDPQQALKNASELIGEDHILAEMRIDEWLFNMNLQKFAKNFHKENLKWVMDLKDVTDYEKFGIKTVGHLKRIQGVLQGNDDAKRNFGYMSYFAIREKVQLYTQDDEKIKRICKMVPEDKITGFQLYDMLEEFVQDEKKLQKIINYYLSLGPKNSYGFEEIEEEEKEEEVIPKQVDIKEMLQKLDLDRLYEALQKFQCTNPEIFWTLSDDDKNLVFEEAKLCLGQKLKFNRAFKAHIEEEKKVMEKIKKEKESKLNKCKFD